MVFEYIAVISTFAFIITLALGWKQLKQSLQLTIHKDAKIVCTLKSNKNVIVEVVRPDGNTLKIGKAQKKGEGTKISSDSIYIDEATGRHFLFADELKGTTFDPIKRDTGGVDAKLIEQMNRESAAIALAEKGDREEVLIKMMWWVIGVGLLTFLTGIAIIWVTNGNADMLVRLLALAVPPAAPVV